MHHLEIVKILIASGAFVNQQDEVSLALINVEREEPVALSLSLSLSLLLSRSL